MANLSNIITPTNVLTATSTNTLTNKTWNSNTIAVAYGGTGATSLTANSVLLGNGTSAIQAIASGTSGQVLTSNGSGAAPTWQNAGAGSSQWTTSGSDIYYTTGKVTIGTVSTSLQGAWVGTNSGGEVGFGFRNNATATNTAAALYLQAWTSDSTQAGRTKIAAIKDSTTFGTDLAFFTTTGTGGTTTEAMRINNAQQVGIGTISPQGRLHASGSSGSVSWGSGGSQAQLAADLMVGDIATNGGTFAVRTNSNSTYASGLGIDGTFDGGPGISTVNLKAFGVQAGGYSSAISFQTTSGTTLTERARITGGGDLLVGTTTSNGRTTVTTNNDQKVLQLNQTNASPSASSTLLYINQATATQTPPAIQYYSASFGGGIYFQVLGNGNVQNANNSYGSTSDIKLKENITDATPKLEALNQLRVVNYNFKGQTLKQIGLIAQEVEQVFPGLVDATPDLVEVTKTRTVEVPAVLDEEGNEVMPATTREETYTEREPNGEVTKSVKYSVLVPMLLKAVQELTAMNDELRQRVATLEQASK